MKSIQTKYKTTNIPWLPTVPQDWDLVKTKFLFNERVQKGFDAEPLLAATQSQGVIPKSLYETNTVTAQKDFHLLKLVTVGDFVISLRSFQGGIEYAYYRGIISPAYTVFFSKNTQEVNPQFYRYFFKSLPFVKSLTLFVTGIREGQNIDYNEFKNSLLPVPPIEEQNAIANYLDAQNEKINLFIANKQKLIALLKEQKNAIITEIITTHNSTKETNKSNWQNLKLKYLVSKVGGGVTPDGGATSYLDYGITFLRSQNIYNDKIVLEDVAFISEETHNSMSGSKVKVGDVLLNITGGSLGRCFYADENLGEANVNQHISIVRPNRKKILTEFLHLLLISDLGQHQINFGQTGGNREGLTAFAIKNFKFPVPPLEEQMQTINIIQEETAKIDEVIIRTEKEIELIKEYRQSIIAEVVTGKIKVAN